MPRPVYRFPERADAARRYTWCRNAATEGDDEMIDLFWHPRTRAARVAWMLEETGVAYRRVFVDIANAGERDSAFLAASPLGKVPALRDGEVYMADSAAICLYLADRYPARGLAPPIDAPERGMYLYWMMYSPAVMEPAISEKVAGVKPNSYSSGWGDFDRMIAALEKALAVGPWLLGERFSAADVMVGSSVHFLSIFQLLPDSAVLKGYMERCLARPAWRQAMAGEEPPPA